MEVPLTSLQAIFERAAFGVGQVSPAGDRQFLNDRFCEIVGYSREELFASSERDILMPMIALRQTKSYGGSWPGEISSSSLENRYVPERWNHRVRRAVCLSFKGSRLTGRNVSF